MAQSSPQRRRYFAARRRGLSQTDARKEVGVSRSSAWRYDQLFNLEVAQRTAALEAFRARRDARRANEDSASPEPLDGASKEQRGPATFPEPPWIEGRSRTNITDTVTTLPENESLPLGMIEREERRQRADGARLPSPSPRAVIVARGSMPSEEPNMGGTLARPFLPEDPPNFLPGVV
jgi:hypothetical protein